MFMRRDMTEYIRTEEGSMYPGFALHAKKLIQQYRSLNIEPDSERYDITLLLSILHCIINIQNERLRNHSKRYKNEIDIWEQEINDIPHILGIKKECIKTNTFYEKLVRKGFLTHVRNGMSHPNSNELEQYANTGYITLLNHTGIIHKIRFTDSPWVKNGRVAKNSDKGIKFETYKKLLNEKKISYDEFDGVLRDKNNEILYPKFVVEMRVDELYDFVEKQIDDIIFSINNKTQERELA